MKLLKQLLPCLMLMSLSYMLGSCCGSSDKINSRDGVYFDISDSYRIWKIELIGTNKAIEYGNTGDYETPRLTLNPADSSCTFCVYYQEKDNPGVLGNGTIRLEYSARPEYQDEDCSEGMLITYNNTRITQSSFAYTRIKKSSNYDGPAIEIEP